MCGRFGYTEVNKEKVKKLFRLKKVQEPLTPRYNIAPGQNVPVILNTAPEELTALRWGLVPFWAKDAKIGSKMINARAETIAEKPSFRGPLKHKRCLILATQFYEWKREESGKQPYCIELKSKEPFAFAGLWDRWDKGEKPLSTCTIMTCAPNARLKEIHDRMPVILPQEAYAEWLSDASPKHILKWLQSYPAEAMHAYPISKRLNSPEHDDAEILKQEGSCN